MNRARVLTPWTGDGTTRTTAFGPKLVVDHPLPTSGTCVDVTGQPAQNLVPTPNLFTVEILCDAATMTAIQNDANYNVLWVE